MASDIGAGPQRLALNVGVTPNQALHVCRRWKSERKSLLIRANFVLGKHQVADRLTYLRWRRVLVEALPILLGCARRCPHAERVRLHRNEGEARFSPRGFAFPSNVVPAGSGFAGSKGNCAPGSRLA